MWRLHPEDLQALSLGSAVVGSGGGGSVSMATVVAERALELTGPLNVVDPAELASGARVAAVGLAGSLTVFEEKPAAGPEMLLAARALERHTGHRVDAVMGFEAAGANALLAVAAAASLGVPLVDADVMGRAFPRMDQTLFTLGKIPVSPLAMVDDRGTTVVLDRVDPPLAELFVRSVVVAMGGWAIVALAPAPAATLVGHTIPDAVSRLLDLGRRLQTDDLPAALAAHRGSALFHGRVVEIARSEGGPVTDGSAVLECVEVAGRLARVEFQSENLLFIEEGRVRASVPDVICLIDPERHLPVSCEDVRNGLDLVVVTLPSAERWRTPEGLHLVGPAAFGYDVAYVTAAER